MTDTAETALANITRRMSIECQSFDMQNWSVATQRQAILLSGREVSKRSMVDVWREHAEATNLMSEEDYHATCVAAGQRRQNVEAGAALLERNRLREAVALVHGAALAQQRTAEDVRRIVERLKR